MGEWLWRLTPQLRHDYEQDRMLIFGQFHACTINRLDTALFAGRCWI